MAETTISANMIKLKEVTTKIKTETDPIKRKELFSTAIDLLAEEYLSIAEEAIETLLEVKGRIYATQGNYAGYIQFLTDPNLKLKGAFFWAMVKALRKAGAGMGLDSAIRIIKGE